MKRCLDCQQDQPLGLFNKDRSRADGYAAYCRPCFKVRRDKWYYANARAVSVQQRFEGGTVKRRPNGAKLMPSWFESDKVRKVYERAADLGLTVDHIVPTKHPLVCGLHCWDNLQVLASSLNASKGNRSWPDMP